MNVSLTPELERFVQKEVAEGMYQTASEVIRAGLRRLKEDQAARTQRSSKTFAELEDELMQAAESLDAGRGVRAEDVFARLKKRSKARRNGA